VVKKKFTTEFTEFHGILSHRDEGFKYAGKNNVQMVSMKLKDLCSYLDSAVPLSFQESYDNSGLQLGSPEKKISSAIITVDVTEQVVEEAITKKCDVIISHHPLIFSSLKRLTGSDSTQRAIAIAIKNDIAVYSAHTNLDVISTGVSRKMAEKLNLLNIRVLSPLKNRLLKLVTFIPEKSLDDVREALFDAGAGVIGNYDRCAFTVTGTGSFRGNNLTDPYVGRKGRNHFEKEVRFETILFSHLKNKVINALLKAHPYEEVAYDLYPLDNENIEIGLGCVGDLKKPVEEKKFLELISKTFQTDSVRYSGASGKKIRKVALCGGAGISLLNEAKAARADAFVTSDIKYHNFFDAGDSILLVDTGHYESEKFSTEILYELIRKKFPTFALRFSEINTNPINYL
jgi:dinuclear metal center YbgI/SA1388 family protein